MSMNLLKYSYLLYRGHGTYLGQEYLFFFDMKVLNNIIELMYR